MNDKQIEAQMKAAIWNAVAQLGSKKALEMMDKLSREVRADTTNDGDFNRFQPGR